MIVLAVLCLAIALPPGSALFLTFGDNERQLPERDSKWSFTDPQDIARKQMLFLHFEKSAGTYVGGILRSAVGDADYIDYHQCSVPITNVPGGYFVVAAIRNPCSQAVSQWEYQCEKTYLLRVHGQQDGAANAQHLEEQGMCPSLTSSMNTQTSMWEAFPVDPNYDGFFASLSEDAGRANMYQAQIQGNLQSIGFDRVDCWVRFEDLDATMNRCLQEFRAATGKPVNLTAVEAPSRKVALGVQAMDSHHGSCKDYYPNTPAGNAAAARVLNGNRMLFEYFNYTTCC
mmetsp:Transcript_72096/g.211226  ORF Transcript_72096/g.211226 Transcript_72096/m.211226 type:complete len:286 (-) Transcript_72096:113-970(-)